MHRFPLFLALIAILRASSVELTAAETKPALPPNIVFIVADDLGWGDVSWHGAGIKTPNLERLGHDGILLEQHYVAPVCTPTRAQFMSGRYASRFGITVPQDERAFPFGTVTLASALKEMGYDTALIGKWHLGGQPADGPRKFGFDHSYGTLHGACGPYNHLYHDAKPTWHRDDVYIEEKGHATDLITAEAVKWIESRTDKPFFLYLPYTAPHVPIDEPEQWLNLYADRPDPGDRIYPACISHMDDGIGQVIQALERTGKRANTIVVFTSDNGAWRGARNPKNYPPGLASGINTPLRGKKGDVYEGGIRVPALINWPGHLAPGSFDSPIRRGLAAHLRRAGRVSMPDRPEVGWPGCLARAERRGEAHSATDHLLGRAVLQNRRRARRGLEARGDQRTQVAYGVVQSGGRSLREGQPRGQTGRARRRFKEITRRGFRAGQRLRRDSAQAQAGGG
jgi:hypothetical protein